MMDIEPETEVSFSLILKDINSNDREERYRAVQNVRKLLSTENNPPIDQVISYGLVPILHEYLKSDDSDIQFEAAWALTNVSSGSTEHTAYTIENEIHKSIMDILSSSNNVELLDQCIWAIGNMAGDSPQNRDIVLDEGIVPIIIDILNNHKKVSLVSNVCWTMSNLFRGTPRPSFAITKPLLPSISDVLLDYRHNSSIISDTLWALSFLTEPPPDEETEVFESIIEEGLVETMVDILMDSKDNSVITPAFRALGNMLSGDDYIADVILDANFLEVFPAFLSGGKVSFRKELYWILSNISSGTESQIQKLIDSGLLATSIEVGIANKQPNEVKREIQWCICNAISGTTPEQLVYMLKKGVVSYLCKSFEFSKTQDLLHDAFLDAISIIFKRMEVGITANPEYLHLYSYVDSSELFKLIDDYKDHAKSLKFPHILKNRESLVAAIKEIKATIELSKLEIK